MKGLQVTLFAAFLVSLSAAVYAQNMNSKAAPAIKIRHLEQDFEISELANDAWKNGTEVLIHNYWSGEKAPEGRWAKAHLLWSATAFYVRFEVNQVEALIVANEPDLTKKSIGLWDRDVCEIFIAPDKSARNKYLEFEAAPTGEWVDLAINVLPKKRITDLDYHSGMQTVAKIEKDKVIIAIKIEWKAFGKTPKAGDIWLGNLFRCIGSGPRRGYLAWQATKTKTPSFHVPKAFGEFQFVE